MNNHNNNHHSSHLGSGFLLGVIVGAAIVFLFATKKGKKILKLLSEEGLKDIASALEGDGDYEEDEIERVPEEPIISSTGEPESQNGETNGKPKKKRFFKRVK